MHLYITFIPEIFSKQRHAAEETSSEEKTCLKKNQDASHTWLLYTLETTVIVGDLLYKANINQINKQK